MRCSCTNAKSPTSHRWLSEHVPNGGVMELHIPWSSGVYEGRRHERPRGLYRNHLDVELHVVATATPQRASQLGGDIAIAEQRDELFGTTTHLVTKPRSRRAVNPLIGTSDDRARATCHQTNSPSGSAATPTKRSRDELLTLVHGGYLLSTATTASATHGTRRAGAARR